MTSATKAPPGYVFELAGRFIPPDWKGEPVLVLQPQFGLFLDLGDAMAARGRLGPSDPNNKHLVPVLVQLHPLITKETNG